LHPSDFKGIKIDGHEIDLKISHRKSETQKPEGKNGKAVTAKGTKLLIRNVPFEATKKEIHELFRFSLFTLIPIIGQNTIGDVTQYPFAEPLVRSKV